MASTARVASPLPRDAPVRPTVRQRARQIASNASAGPRRMVQQLMHWKQFKGLRVPKPTPSNSAPCQAASVAAPALMGAAATPGARPAAGGGRRPGVVWFRCDLRLDDHEALTRAAAECSSLLPVYCFDPRDYCRSPQGYDRTGPYRASFLIQAVADLRQRLRAVGSDLLVRMGRPEEVLPEVARRMGAGAVYCHSEVTAEEQAVESNTAAALRAAGVRLHTFWTNTLHRPQDLPFKLADLPQNFDRFRRSLAEVAPRPALAAAAQLKAPPVGARTTLDPGDIPTLQQLGLEPLADKGDAGGDAPNCGGESEALRQLHAFIAAAAGAAGGNGAAYERSFTGSVAPFLATGCLSPRRLLQEVQRALGGTSAAAQQAEGGSGSLQWVQFELLWRDFFRLLTKRHSEVVLPMVRQALAASPAAPALAAA